MTALELENVELFAGDLHALDAAALGGPFDLAFTRLFLMHQADPVRTLGQTVTLLRPGGWIVVHEPLRSVASAIAFSPGLRRRLLGAHARGDGTGRRAARDRGRAAASCAKDGGYDWVSTPFFLNLALRKPRS